MGGSPVPSSLRRPSPALKELLVEHDPTRDDVMAWAKEQARIETDYEFITKRKSTAGKAI